MLPLGYCRVRARCRPWWVGIAAGILSVSGHHLWGTHGKGLSFLAPFHRDVLLPSQTPWSGRREAQQERAEENGGRIWDLGFDLGDMRDRVVLDGLDAVVGGKFHRHFLMDATPLGVDGRLEGVSGTLGAKHCWLLGWLVIKRNARERGGFTYTPASARAFPKKGKHFSFVDKAWRSSLGGEGERDLALALPTTLISWGSDYGCCYWLRTNQKTKERDLHESYNLSVRTVPIRRRRGEYVNPLQGRA